MGRNLDLIILNEWIELAQRMAVWRTYSKYILEINILPFPILHINTHRISQRSRCKFYVEPV